MGFFTRGGSILATSIYGDVNAVGLRVVMRIGQFGKGRSNHGVGTELQLESRDVEQEQRELRKPLDVPFPHTRSRPVQIDALEDGCGDGELNSLVGFRVLCLGKALIPHMEDHIAREVTNGRCSSSLGIGHVEEVKYRGLDSDMDPKPAFAECETAENSSSTVLACGYDGMQGRIGGPALGKSCTPNYVEGENVNCHTSVHTEVEQSAEIDVNEIVKSTDSEGLLHTGNLGIVCGSSETNASSNCIKITTGEDTIASSRIELVQNNEVNLPLDNLPSNCGVQEGDTQYPVPLSPLSGELAKSIEYQRAMVAEAAVKSGPAMTRSEVLFEDEWLMVINKPCGMYCEHVLATVPSLLTPAADLSTLSRLTLHRRLDNKDNSVPHLHMANRLDRDTSGVMVITKCRNAAAKLSNIFSNRKVHKSYIALCRGPRPSWKSLTLDSGHGRSRYGAWRVYSKKDVGRGLPGGSVVRDMTTHLVVLSINKQLEFDDRLFGSSAFDKPISMECLVTAGDENSSTILGHSPSEKLATNSEKSSHDSQLSIENDVVIRAIPLTGRTHQIRLHCQFVGLPLRGDVKYGGPHILSGVRYDHHALHAEALSFRHPFTFEELHFVAPLPQWATDAGVQPPCH